MRASGTAVGEGKSGGFRLAGVDHRLERGADRLGRHACEGARSLPRVEHANALLAPAPPVAAEVALGLVEWAQPLHGGTVGARPDGADTLPVMAEPRARVFEYRVSTDADWTAHSDRGGTGIVREDAWTPEHLLLASLTRCTLTSLEYHARRADVTFTSRADAHATVTRREMDGRFAVVETSVAFDVSFEPQLEAEARRDLLAKAERDCFVGASLTAKPTYTWKVDGEEL